MSVSRFSPRREPSSLLELGLLNVGKVDLEMDSTFELLPTSPNDQQYLVHQHEYIYQGL